MVYGGTSAAVIAAVQAKELGQSVLIVCPDAHLGGMTASGLGWTDSGNKAVIGGKSREFYARLKAHYDDPAAWREEERSESRHYRADSDAIWVFEPHVAEALFEELVREAEVPVLRGRWLDRDTGVEKSGAKITAIRMESGETFTAEVFIDATYEGDLMAAAGVGYHVGREANAVYSETLNGVQTRNARSHQFKTKVDPYLTPGDPESGLLARVHAGEPGAEGEGDHRVQAYNYRLCMTDAPSNRVPFAKPEGYDPAQYELLARALQSGARHVFGKFDPMPNRKTDTNNHGAFSTDNIGMNYEYPEASYERRGELLEEHERYQRGYLWFLTNDPRVPMEIRERMGRWGLAADEFTDNAHWPHQIYVREARRMVSDFVMTERHLRGTTPTPNPVGMGSYNMDSHNVQRYVAFDADDVAYVQNEGDIQINPGGPYPISYEAIIPKSAQCTNLLVPVCLSSSHIAYGSIRMEPVFMILGQSAATAACMAIEAEVAVQDVDRERLRTRLLAAGQVLEYVAPPPEGAIPLSKLGGAICDDSEANFVGEWTPSVSTSYFAGAGYRHDNNEPDGKRAIFTVRLPAPGRYEVQAAYSAHPNRASSVPVTVEHAGGSTTVSLNQRRVPTVDQIFQPLGVFEFSGTSARVTLSNEGVDGHVIADAIRCVSRP